MGCAPSKSYISTTTTTTTLKNEQMDKKLKQDYILQQQTFNLLLLGSSDSGKSTLVKQMKILHTGGFTDSELKNYRYLIFGNIVEAVESLVEGAAFLGITLGDECQKKVSLFCEVAVGNKYGQTLELASQIWKSPQIQECFSQKHRLALPENVEYFLSNLHRIASDGYIPNNMDILCCRNHTSGVYCTEFRQSEKHIRLIDVGGQKSERRKWIHYFDDVTVVLFVATLSGYDQVLQEKPTVNRMVDALALFDEICRSDYFLQTTIVLFLRKKLKKSLSLSVSLIIQLLHWCVPYAYGWNSFGAFFAGSHLETTQMMKLLFIFSKYPLEDFAAITGQTGITTHNAIVKYHKEFKLIQQDWVWDNLLPQPLGGLDPQGQPKVVEIDESVFHKTKYHVGRVRTQNWVFGMLERESRKIFVLPVARRDAATLLPLIDQYIAPRTNIISDGWASYGGLNNIQHQWHNFVGQKYIHQWVNHRQNFVDPNDPHVHTQGIESHWNQLKRDMKKKMGTSQGLFETYLYNFMFRKAHQDTKIFQNMCFWMRH